MKKFLTNKYLRRLMGEIQNKDYPKPTNIIPLNDFTKEELIHNGWIEKDDGRFEK